MCRYVLPLPTDAITPVQRGIFVTYGFCVNLAYTKSYQAFNVKAKAKDLECKAKD